jgi:methylenetetrahydrofolate--tRNA-(uracil-5-)-methyltransferase
MNSPSDNPVIVIGGGLAGSEAAWQLARRGVPVRLFEMRPERTTEAHRTGRLAELVCSNSFKSDVLPSAPALLKREMRALGSLVLAAGDGARVPAGTALAVDRGRFAAEITRSIEEEPLITVVRGEARSIPEEGDVIFATGPLTSEAFAESLTERVGEERLYFYDAISPVVSTESLDHDVVFAASRYGKGGGDDYLNVPLSRDGYEHLIRELSGADLYPLHEFERTMFFEACLPIEEIARRGKDSLRFGPMKPVGLEDPRTGSRPYAALQLRKENREETAYNLVGCQTRMRRGEQKRIFRSLPGLERVEFLRFGSLHRNTYLCAPKLLGPGLEIHREPRLRLAGQITGVEGYLESTATGLVAAIETARARRRLPPTDWPRATAIGALLHHLRSADPDNFQPTNIHFGLFPPVPGPRRRGKRARNEEMVRRAEEAFEPIAREASPTYP